MKVLGKFSGDPVFADSKPLFQQIQRAGEGVFLVKHPSYGQKIAGAEGFLRGSIWTEGQGLGHQAGGEEELLHRRGEGGWIGSGQIGEQGRESGVGRDWPRAGPLFLIQLVKVAGFFSGEEEKKVVPVGGNCPEQAGLAAGPEKISLLRKEDGFRRTLRPGGEGHRQILRLGREGRRRTLRPEGDGALAAFGVNQAVCRCFTGSRIRWQRNTVRICFLNPEAGAKVEIGRRLYAALGKIP